LHNEELHNLYSSPNATRVIEFREVEMGRTCTTYAGEEECIQGIGGEGLKERDQ
jgi:hypothetical protein